MYTHTVFTIYKWRLDNFNRQVSAIKGGESIVSDVFSLNGNSKAKFSLKIKRHALGYCEFYLVCIDFGQITSMDLNVNIWQEDLTGVIDDGQEFQLNLNSTSITGDLKTDYYLACMEPYVIDDLFICCEIQHEEPKSEFHEHEFEEDKEELAMRNGLGQKLLKLHSDGHLDSTITIQAGGQDFKASKLTLMACSEVFHRILSSPESTEAKIGVIKDEETKPEVIDALIHWIYQVEIDNMEETALDLYKAANKYEITLLKKKCLKIMAKSLSKENLASRLILAYKYKEEAFKQHVLNFLREDKTNLVTLMASDEWLTLCREDPDAVKKIGAEIYG